MGDGIKLPSRIIVPNVEIRLFLEQVSIKYFEPLGEYLITTRRAFAREASVQYGRNLRSEAGW